MKNSETIIISKKDLRNAVEYFTRQGRISDTRMDSKIHERNFELKSLWAQYNYLVKKVYSAEDREDPKVQRRLEKVTPSPEFLKMAESFVGKKEMLLVRWLRKVADLLVNDELKITVLKIDKDNVDDLKLPADGLLSLEIDANMKNEKWPALRETIQARGLPIQSITVSNASAAGRTAFKKFIEGLYNVELVKVEGGRPEDKLTELANNVTHRNHLIWEFDIEVTPGLDPWPKIITKWSAVLPYRAEQRNNKLCYLKIFDDSITNPVYAGGLNAVYGMGREEDQNYKTHDWSTAYSYYSTINSSIAGMGDLFFTKMLEHLEENLNRSTPTELELNEELSDENIKELTAWIKAHPDLPFATLSICIKPESDIEELLESLKGASIKAVELVFGWKETKKFTDEFLINKIAKHADYPVRIMHSHFGSNIGSERTYEQFPGFYQAMLANIRQRNIEKLQLGAPPEVEVKAQGNGKEKEKKGKKKKGPEIENESPDDWGDAIGKEVPIVLEIVEVEVEQEQQVLEFAEAENLGAYLEDQQQDHARFDGELIDRGTYHRHPYYGMTQENYYRTGESKSEKVIDNELFGNLPNAIKFLSPEAASYMAKNDAAFASLNVTNLPIGFIVKKTSKGELVLDYDKYSTYDKTNVFTPKPWRRFEYRDPIYNEVGPSERELKACVSNDELFNLLFMKEVNRHLATVLEYKPKQIENLWIKFGPEGTKLFFAKLNELDAVHNGFTEFLYKSHLQYFSQWDHFLDDSSFMGSLDRIKEYDKTKLDCLKKFLEHAGVSRTELRDTLDAFDVFWNEYLTLCAKGQVEDIEIINQKTWSTPNGGNSIVYMERMLTILQNARNLSEQLACLDEIVLDNYGAYYASKYEGFKVVAKGMALNYISMVRDRVPFNPNASVYRIELDALAKMTIKPTWLDLVSYPDLKDRFWLIRGSEDEIPGSELEGLKVSKRAIPYTDKDFVYPYKLYMIQGNTGALKCKASEKPVTEDWFKAWAYRFVGTQQSGITIPNFAEGAEYFKAKWSGGYDKLKPTLLHSLFFITHDRYQGTVPYKELLDCIEPLKGWDLIFKTNEELLELYKLDVKLSDVEGYTIAYKLAGMQSTRGFESVRVQGKGLDKGKYAFKLYKHLRENKYGTLKFLEEAVKNQRELFVYALDSADYLAEGTNIGVAYKDDLLLFTYLLRGRENYLDGREDTDAIDAIKRFLLKAANSEKPNNLDTAFHIMTASREYLYYSDVLAAFSEIDALGNKYNYQETLAVLRKHRFTIKAELPEVFKRDSIDVKATLMPLVFALRRMNQPEADFAKLLIGPRPELARVNKELRTLRDEIIDTEQHGRRVSYLETRIAKVNKKIEGLSSPADAVKLQGLGEKLKKLEVEKAEKQATYERLKPELDVKLEKLGKQKEELEQRLAALKAECDELDAIFKQPTKEVLEELSALWQQHGPALEHSYKAIMLPLLQNLKNVFIASETVRLATPGLPIVLDSKLGKLNNFDATTFAGVNRIAQECESIVNIFLELEKSEVFKSQFAKLNELFIKTDFSKLDYEALQAILQMFTKMPARDYLGILEKIITTEWLVADKSALLMLLNLTERLHKANFPNNYIENLITNFPNSKKKQGDFGVLVQEIIPIFEKDNDDALVAFINKNLEPIYPKTFVTILALAEQIDCSNSQVAKLCTYLAAKNQMALFPKLEVNAEILEILTKCHAVTDFNNKPDIDYIKLAKDIKHLDRESILELREACKVGTPNIFCLSSALNNRNKEQPFADFLSSFEKAPYGARNFEEQFDVSQVERVINDSMDLNNKTKYTYLYRKQLMEAFLFVNAAGKELPIYNGKPAHDLSNKEIRELYGKIRSNELLPDLDPFKRRLYVLALMREAMFRSTNKQPYATQMISIIDCMMHKGDVITNLDTGQGKDLVDTMKTSLLWLDGRADMTTSSLTDAKRNIENYFSYLDLLGIPNTKRPITSTSEFGDFQQDGVNISTFSQLSLFEAKATHEGNKIESKKASLVIGESDDAILDNLVIYRYATTQGAPVKPGDAWVYYAINSYVNKNFPDKDKQLKAGDIKQLRKHLEQEAVVHLKSHKMVREFDDTQLLIWLQSALSVKHKLREDYEYVISPDKEPRKINGKTQYTRVARIIDRSDNRILQYVQYGNGVQQLLYAKLNAENKNNDFIIEAESKTLWSSNNKNLIDDYRGRSGFIWGSSGTVGSSGQVKEQYESYGFEFAGIEPHQKNIVEIHRIVLTEGTDVHKAAIGNQLISKKAVSNDDSHLVFCKDIKTAKALYEELCKVEGLNSKIQLFTGLQNEEEIIRKVSEPGMITISINALGRNTDIEMGGRVLNVIQTAPDSERKTKQKAGRTGRQGKPGNVYHIYNKEDLGGKSVEEFQKDLDKTAEAERVYNERLYDILGYFGNIIKEIEPGEETSKKELLTRWANCRNSIERKYRQTKSPEKFQVAALEAFKKAFINEEAIQDITPKGLAEYINKKHQVQDLYKPYEEKVKLADCTPPSVIAYNMLNFEGEATLTTDGEQKSQTKIKELFAGLAKGEVDKTDDYLRYLSETELNQKSILSMHRLGISDLLKEQIAASKNMGFVKRWLGFESSLSKIASNRNYLIMFKAFTDMSGGDGVADIKDIKASITTLLDDYLATSWFVSPLRIGETRYLKGAIQSAVSIDEIVSILAESKVTVLGEDLASDKTRWFKRINYFGNSRFQNTLDSALNLTSALSGKQSDTLISGLLNTVAITPPAAMTFDNLKLATTSLSSKSPTAKVIIKSLNIAIDWMLHTQPMTGMQGRQ